VEFLSSFHFKWTRWFLWSRIFAVVGRFFAEPKVSVVCNVSICTIYFLAWWHKRLLNQSLVAFDVVCSYVSTFLAQLFRFFVLLLVVIVRAHSFPQAAEFALCRGILTFLRNLRNDQWLISMIVGMMTDSSVTHFSRLASWVMSFIALLKRNKKRSCR